MRLTQGLKVLSILSILVLSFTLISALSLTAPIDLSLSKNETTITLTNTNVSQDININIADIIQGPNQILLSVSPEQVTLAPNGKQTLTVMVDNIIGSLKFGTHTTTLSAQGTETSENVPVRFVKGFCSSGEIGGNLRISNIDINSDGDEDDEWKPLDRVEVEVEVENKGNDDVDDVRIEIGLFDSNGVNQINDLKFLNTDEEEIDVGRIRDGKDETVTFEFIIPADIDDGKYMLAVKAFSDDVGENKECTDTSDDLNNDFFQTIDIIKEDDEGKFIAFDNVVLSPERATCGDAVTMTFDVFNIGDEDQDQVKINLDNVELGIDQSFEIRSDLDQGDEQSVTFRFEIPNNAQDRTYALKLSAEYDFRNNIYRERSDRTTDFPITVIGCSGTQTPTRLAGISASLASGAEAGKELVVRATITNLDSKTNTFNLNVRGHESWAELESINPRSLTLEAGRSQEVTLRFTVDEDSKGENSFLIEAISGANIDSREVLVEIESTGNGAFADLFKGNALIWVIGIVNAILIILIIVVAVRLARRE